MAVKEIRYNSREEWLELRQGYIGGSDAGAVVGLNPYKSAFTLWAEKTGKVPPFEGNLTTEVGSYLEEFVAQLFCRETLKNVRRKNAILVSDLYPFACANVDRMIVGEKAFLEIKTTNSIPLMRKLRDSEEFPDAYYAQCVHYMAFGFQKCYLAVLINCRELKIYTLEKDQAEINALMEAEKKFWYDNVLALVPPAIDGSDSTAETVEAITGASTDAEADLTPLADELRHYETLQGLQKDTEKAMEEIKSKIKAYMGDAGRGAFDRYTITYKTQQRTTFDRKALAADHQELSFGKYEKVSESRPMTIRIKASV